MKGSESVHLCCTNITAIDQVKDLKEYERVEYQGEVGHLSFASRCIFDCLSGIGVLEVAYRLASVHDDHHDCNHV